MSLQRNENRGKALKELEAHKKELEEKLSNVLDEISQHTGSTENGTTRHKSPYRSSVHSASMHNKSGYLHKWQDRAIGWSGTKWDLRWVRLENGRLAYYKSHNDQAPRYVLTLKRCAIRDDGCKVNRRYRHRSGDEPDYQTPGAFYHVFSIYQRPENTTADDSAEDDQEEDIVPLLRFSTTSNAEKMQWMEMLSEACAYCDSNDFLHEKDSTRSTNEQFFQYKEKPIAAHGTLPPMYFAPPMPPKLKRMPSNHKMAKTSSYVKLNKHKDASKSNPKRKSEYPPSKPMHRTSEASYLSNEAAIQNYRGILNLGLIILFISNFRLMLATMSEHGFVLSGSVSPQGVVRSWASGDFISFPLVSGLCLLNVFVLYGYVIELCTSRLMWNENVGNFLHVLNIIACFVIPCMLVWYLEKSPIIGACLLLTSMVLWMKLVSYAHANADYRKNPERTSNGAKAMIQDLDENSKGVKYPENVTLSNIYYFWFAPTLTYQIAFPHLPRRRSLLRIVKLTLSLFVTGVVILFLIAQVIRPSLTHMMQELEEETDENRFSIHIIAEYLLKLAMASTYVWLLVFYGFFHVFLNLLAEIMKFGDRGKQR
jgi:diacylglycerol O-acyltransferase-1